MNIGWTPEQLAAAITILVGCITANIILVTRTYTRVVNMVEGLHRSGVQIRGTHGRTPQPVAAASSALAGSGGGIVTLPLDPVNQLTGVTVSTAPAPTRAVDCGPACVVSCIEEMKGCWSADELLRLRYFGVIDNRLTTASDLVGMLMANGIQAHKREPVDAATARIEIVRNADAGRPCLVLGTWVSPGFKHWCKYVGDITGPIVMNPYGGVSAQWSWDFFNANFSGAYVHVDSLPDAPI